MYVNGRICFGSATPMCMGDHESLDWRSPRGSEVEVDVAELGAPDREDSNSPVARQGQAIPHSLAYHLFASHVS